MTLRQIRDKAREMKVRNYSRLRKDQLIRTIQQTEGNHPCFKNVSDCGEHGCLWWTDCRD